MPQLAKVMAAILPVGQPEDHPFDSPHRTPLAGDKPMKR
jgi:hypothetical protein